MVLPPYNSACQEISAIPGQLRLQRLQSGRSRSYSLVLELEARVALEKYDIANEYGLLYGGPTNRPETVRVAANWNADLCR